jgi:LysR family transcriptional regulator, transcriptional activator of nhaA
MEWMNYHHLLYFWTVAKEGSISRACGKLGLAQPTISGQLRQLEEVLGEKLFTRAGRGLALTEVGQVVYRYAEEIFSTGRELMDVLKGRPHGRPARFTVGISDLVPKLIAYEVLAPALSLPEPVQLVCYENKPQSLLAELSSHRLDMVLTEAPVSGSTSARAYNHLLGSCNVIIFAAAPLAARYGRRFPASLNDAPFLLPMEGCTLRRSLEQWFDAAGVRPRCVGEFQDSALLKVFGQAGAGLFAVPSAIENEVRKRYNAKVVGRVDSIVEHFYAITVQRKLKHPAVLAIAETARTQIFGWAPS